MPENNKTAMLEKFNGQYVRVNYNVAQDAHKPSVLICGTLLVCPNYYSVIVTGNTWIAFTDENISCIWKESEPYIELKA